MKKQRLLVLLAAALCLSACSDINVEDPPASSQVREDSLISEEAAEEGESLWISEEESAFSSESSGPTAEESGEEPTEESTPPQVTESSTTPEINVNAAEICATVAAVKESGFTTDIDDPKVQEKLKELQDYLEGSGYGFFYCDLEFTRYISYGTDKQFHTASTSKLPYIKHLAERVDAGEIDLNEKLVQLAEYHDPGSGILKNNTPGGSYSVATLMDYVLRYSDNIAYKMLIQRFGLSEFKEGLKSIGVSFETYNGYGHCTASEMAAMLFDVATYDGGCLELIQNAACNASYNWQFGAELSEYKVMQKYGVIKPSNLMYHDIAVVYAPKPYLIVMYTNINYDSADKNVPFRKVGRLIEEIDALLR